MKRVIVLCLTLLAASVAFAAPPASGAGVTMTFDEYADTRCNDGSDFVSGTLTANSVVISSGGKCKSVGNTPATPCS